MTRSGICGIRGLGLRTSQAMNQNYDNIVDRDTVNMQSYNELSLVSVPAKVQLCTTTAYFVKLLIILAEMCRKKMEAMKESERTRTMNGSPLKPGESSVYSLSMVFDEPPAPADRDELGFETVFPVARRRTAAPGGLATPEAERPVLGESESDIVCFASVVVDQRERWQMWSRGVTPCTSGSSTITLGPHVVDPCFSRTRDDHSRRAPGWKEGFLTSNTDDLVEDPAQ